MTPQNGVGTAPAYLYNNSINNVLGCFVYTNVVTEMPHSPDRNGSDRIGQTEKSCCVVLQLRWN